MSEEHLSGGEDREKMIRRAKTNIAIIAAFVIALIVIAAMSFSGGTPDGSETRSQQSATIVADVNSALDELDPELKDMLASHGGYAGSISRVEAYGSDGAKIYVTTHFDDANEGKEIARKIFSNICIQVPELSSVYVSSTNTGLDSRSIYRSDLRVCQ